MRHVGRGEGRGRQPAVATCRRGRQTSGERRGVKRAGRRRRCSGRAGRRRDLQGSDCRSCASGRAGRLPMLTRWRHHAAWASQGARRSDAGRRRHNLRRSEQRVERTNRCVACSDGSQPTRPSCSAGAICSARGAAPGSHAGSETATFGVGREGSGRRGGHRRSELRERLIRRPEERVHLERAREVLDGPLPLDVRRLRLEADRTEEIEACSAVGDGRCGVRIGRHR
mmetsp:Transcript_9503/g.28940  ORF Transcript_9503/g.28940 Transcript_9503/m.28940 type:complete len:227 (-) Transcript_9503:285-965(-)